jgi:hypothetical protein
LPPERSGRANSTSWSIPSASFGYKKQCLRIVGSLSARYKRLLELALSKAKKNSSGRAVVTASQM